MSGVVSCALLASLFSLMTEYTTVCFADEPIGHEAVTRTLVRVNAEMDMATLSHFMAHDAGIELTVWNKSVGLEQRQGRVVLHSWHESFRNIQPGAPLAQRPETPSPQHLTSNTQPTLTPDLSGEWDILEVEDDKRYRATLDKLGNGPYTQHGGRFITTKFADRLWQGTWQQPGNDREGGFELLLSEDGTEANGVWWYSRVGNQKNIPPREHGGSYQWKRLTPVPSSQ